MSRRLLVGAALSACLLGTLVCTAFAAAAPRRSATAHATAPRRTLAGARHGRATPSRQAAEPGHDDLDTGRESVREDALAVLGRRPEAKLERRS